MLTPEYKNHFKENINLAFPVVLSQLGHIMVSVFDSIMVGQLGTPELAAASLSTSVSTLVMVFGLGLSYSITPLVAGAAGRKNKNRISLLLLNGLVLCTVAGLFLSLGGILAAPLLKYLDQPKEVVDLTIPFVNIIFLSLFPLMVFQGFKQFAEGLSFTKQAMYISVFANLLNIAGNYILIYGKFGLPAFGMNGAALSTLISRILMALLMGFYVLKADFLKPYRIKVHKKLLSIHHLWRIFKLGFPISVQMIFEMGAFSFSAIMIGWLGAKELAAHQIAINIASVTYMMASGIAAAATIRVGNLLGQGKYKQMQQAGYSNIMLAILFMAGTGVILILGKNIIPGFYSTDSVVVNMAAGLLIIAALFQISDGVQVVGLGTLRGLEDVKLPSLISLIAYWVFALPVSYVLCFKFGFGVYGIWAGLLIGLSLAAIFLFLRFRKLSTKAL